MNLNRNTVYTTKRRVTIPSYVTVGQTYYPGVIVDYKDRISEYCETNNATYLPIKIVN